MNRLNFLKPDKSFVPEFPKEYKLRISILCIFMKITCIFEATSTHEFKGTDLFLGLSRVQNKINLSLFFGISNYN
jgi:hypothetical protein